MVIKQFRISTLLLCVLLVSGLELIGQQPKISSDELLNRSIAYHDPQGIWGSYTGAFTVVSTRPGKSDRISRISMNQNISLFRIAMDLDGVRTALQMQEDQCSLEYQGSSEFSDDIAEQYNLNCDRALMWRDYYSYLYGLPMKLKDPGTRIDPEVRLQKFKGVEYLVLRVTYNPETGKDTWYFYFDPNTYALSVYQFYHDESKNDGEYILLEGESLIKGMRLPEKRSWYTNKEDKFLGADTITDGSL